MIKDRQDNGNFPFQGMTVEKKSRKQPNRKIVGPPGSGEDMAEKNDVGLNRYDTHLEELVAARTKELRASEQRYRELLDSVTDYIYEVRIKDGVPVSSSHGAGCAAVTGYTPRDYQNDTHLWYRMIFEEDRGAVGERIEQLQAGKAVPPFEHRIVSKDGKIRWIENTPVLRFDETGRFAGYQGLIRDITKRKTAEEAVMERYEVEHLLSSLLNASVEELPLGEFLRRAVELIVSAPFIAVEPVGGIFLADNRSGSLVLAAHSGLPPELQTLCARVPFGTCLCGRAAREKRIRFSGGIGTEHEVDYKGMKPHGHYCVPILSEGELLGVMVLYLEEGHRREEREEEFLLAAANTLAGVIDRKRGDAELLRSHALLNAINRAQRGVISEIDPHAVFDELLSDFLPLTESEFGFIAELLHSREGKPFLKLRALTNIAWNDQTRDLFRRFKSEGMEFHNMETLFGAVVKTGKPVIANDPEKDPRSGGLPKGHPPLKSFLGIPYPPEGKMQGIVCAANRPGGYSEDLIDYLRPFLSTCAGIVRAYRGRVKRRKAEESIRKYAGKLEESNRMKDLFTDIMRHDLINPAGLVYNYAELLLSEETDARKKEIIGEIMQNANRLTELIRSAAKYSQLNELERIDFSPLDLCGMVREVIHAFEADLKKKRMTVDFRPGRRRRIVANVLLKDAFANLLSNAVKYSPRGSAVEITVVSKGGNFVVSFHDRGEGIRESDKKRIFERYERVHRKGAQPGAGLGLAIVKRIVELHGGEVSVEDNPGGGSVFSVKLPAR